MQLDLRSVDTSNSRITLTRYHDSYSEGRLRSPQDVARAVTWLAGPWCQGQTGQIFSVANEEWIQQVNADLDQLA